MEVELKLTSLNSTTDKPFVHMPEEFLEIAGIATPASVVITLRELKAGKKVYGYRCKILKNDEAYVIDDTDFPSQIGNDGHMQLPPELTKVKRMALEYDMDDKCLVIWAYID